MEDGRMSKNNNNIRGMMIWYDFCGKLQDPDISNNIEGKIKEQR